MPNEGNPNPHETAGNPNPQQGGNNPVVQPNPGAQNVPGADGEPKAPVLPAWTDLQQHIPQELRAEKSLEAVKDFPGLVKGYIEGQKYIGGSVRLPKEDAGPEEWNKFYTKMGRPETAEGYNLSAPEFLPGKPVPIAIVDRFKGLAHSIGLSSSQAQAALNGWARMTGEDLAAVAKARQTGEESLRKEWGAAYNNNMVYAQQTAKLMFGDDGMAAFERTGAGNDPAIIKGLMKIGALLAEDGVIQTGEEFQAPTAAKSEYDKVQNLRGEERRKHPFFDRKHPEHQEWVDRMYRLQEVMSNTGREE